jgi:hypothetical protein
MIVAATDIVVPKCYVARIVAMIEGHEKFCENPA